MWKEYPLWQTKIYRLLVWAIVAVVGFGLCVSLWLGDWSEFRVVLLWIGIFSAAICSYAALVWTVAHIAVMFWKLFRKFGHRRN